MADAALLALGGAATVALHGLRVAARQSARTGPLMLLGLGVMTPLFQTMTAAISDDKAVATAVCSLVTHLLLHDYAFLNSYTARLGSSVSLAAAMFAAALLASRLPTPRAVFADMLLALVLFIQFPFLRRDVRRASVPAHLLLTALVHAAALAAATVLPLPAHRLLIAAYLAAVLATVLLCPLWQGITCGRFT